MKILIVASEIYGSNYPKQSITGLSIMVRDICDELAKKCDVYMYSTRKYLKPCKESNMLCTLDSRVNNWFLHIRMRDFRIPYNILKKGMRPTLGFVKRRAIDNLIIYRFIKALKNIAPDIVNFHELDNINVRCSEICKDKGIKYIFTDHLYIGNCQGCSAYDYLRNNEAKVFSDNNTIVSTISTGMRDRVLRDYPNLKPENVYMTIDGTNFRSCDSKKLSINTRKVLLCIANVMERKNQVQLIRALSLMDKKEREGFIVYFLGTDKNKVLEKAISQYNCDDVAVYKGKVRSEDMAKYYSQAFATITTTLCEGFGLTIIEGYAYGIPAIIPSDIDSFPDLYTPNTTIAIKNRSDNAIISAIRECLSHKWDASIIKKKAEEFRMDMVSSNYIDMYSKVLN